MSVSVNIDVFHPFYSLSIHLRCELVVARQIRKHTFARHCGRIASLIYKCNILYKYLTSSYCPNLEKPDCINHSINSSEQTPDFPSLRTLSVEHYNLWGASSSKPAQLHHFVFFTLPLEKNNLMRNVDKRFNLPTVKSSRLFFLSFFCMYGSTQLLCISLRDIHCGCHTLL